MLTAPQPPTTNGVHHPSSHPTPHSEVAVAPDIGLGSRRADPYLEESPRRPTSFPPADPSKLIHEICDPHITLRDVAESHNTDLDTLTLWMGRPDVAAQLNNLHNAILTRTRLTAANYLSGAVTSLHQMLVSYLDEETHIPVNPQSIKDRDQRRRARDSARKAVWLLLKLAAPLPAAGKSLETRRAGAAASTTPKPARSPRKVATNTERIESGPLNLHDLRARASRSRADDQKSTEAPDPQAGAPLQAHRAPHNEPSASAICNLLSVTPEPAAPNDHTNGRPPS